MSTDGLRSGELVGRVAAGDGGALEDFAKRFGALAVGLTRKLCPDAQSRTASDLARRALQACVDELPLVGNAFREAERSLDAWVAVVCGRVLHEAWAASRLESAAVRAVELLPEALPSTDHFALRAYYHPSGWLSGDYYDAVGREDGSLVALIADVMGHGAPAALLVSAVKCAFRLGSDSPSSAQVLRDMNAALHGVIPSSCFVVASVLLLGPRHRACTFANAGMQGGAVVARSTLRVEPLELPGRPLGLFAEVEYRQVSRLLRAGDAVFLCTDGVRDLCSEAGAQFGEARLPALLAEAATSGTDLYPLLSGALEQFAPGEQWADDACFLLATAR